MFLRSCDFLIQSTQVYLNKGEKYVAVLSFPIISPTFGKEHLTSPMMMKGFEGRKSRFPANMEWYFNIKVTEKECGPNVRKMRQAAYSSCC